MAIVNALKERELVEVAVAPKSKTTKLLVPELLRFWDQDNSDYIRDRLAHGHSIGKRHATEMTNAVKRAWAIRFPNRTVPSMTRQDLKTFAASLLDSGLSASTVNLTMSAGLTALSYWHREGIIPTDPGAKFERFAGEKAKRGVLTVAEAATLFARNWQDKAAHVGNLVAATTGLRAGEVLAIRKSDIGDTTLTVAHSWSAADGLKCPKNGETRKVPLLPETRAALLYLLKDNPHTDAADPFVFWGTKADSPRHSQRR
jgi:integrase